MWTLAGAFCWYVNGIAGSILGVVMSGCAIVIWDMLQQTRSEKDDDETEEDESDQSRKRKKPLPWITKLRVLYTMYFILSILYGVSIWYIVSKYSLMNWKTWAILILVTSLVGYIVYRIYRWFYPIYFWTRSQLKHKRWNSVVDCRSHTEYLKGHYKGAIHFPIKTLTHDNIADRLKELKSPILVYDNTGVKAKEWKDTFELRMNEMGITGYIVAYTDAHHT